MGSWVGFVQGPSLIGGTSDHTSSRFESPHDAMCWARVVADNNFIYGREITTCGIRYDNREPQISAQSTQKGIG